MAELDWLGVIRHGESTGNVAAARAEAAGEEQIDIPERDADVPLSGTGREQAQAVGRWLAELPAEERPEVVVVSPYRRTQQTAELLVGSAGIPMTRDERLRDRELGILDLLTWQGVHARLPDEAARRSRLGKFYYRPPGGESWADVTLRLRSLLGDLRRDHDGGRVLLVGHEAVVFLLRYLIEDLSEPELMELAVDKSIGNCSITTWRRGSDGALTIADFNRTDHLRREGAERTHEEGIVAEPV